MRVLTHNKKSILGVMLIASVMTISWSPVFAQGGKWFLGSPMDGVRSGLTSSAVNDIIYVIGGTDYNSDVNKDILDTVEIFNPATNTWRAGPSMPTARLNLTSCVVNDKIYVIGGNNFNGYLTTLEIFNPATNSWTVGPSMSVPRDFLSAVVINGKIYVIGGRNSSGSLGTVEIFDPTTNSWSVGPSMPTARAAFTASVVNGKIYTIGGYDGHNTLGTVEIFDPVTNSWSAGPWMPTARNVLTSSVVNNKIYAIGGLDTTHLVTLNTLEIFDPLTNAWSVGPKMPTPRYALTSTVVKVKIYTIGGWNKSPLDTVEIFDPNASWVKNESNSVSISLSPNPTSGVLRVQGLPLENITATVMNMLGETVLLQKNLIAPYFTLDLSMLPSGTYYIGISSANSVVTKMVVKE
ncbi:MAG: kelch repeat-containing protein [bacterium]